MARLIDADSIKYEKTTECFGHGCFLNVQKVYKEDIDRMPTVEVGKWIPVTERLPERGTEVIVCSHRTILPIVFTTNFWDTKHDNWLGITHWMNLPKPPKEVE